MSDDEREFFFTTRSNAWTLSQRETLEIIGDYGWVPFMETPKRSFYDSLDEYTAEVITAGLYAVCIPKRAGEAIRVIYEAFAKTGWQAQGQWTTEGFPESSNHHVLVIFKNATDAVQFKFCL